MNADAAPAPTALRDLITGGWVSQAVYVAAKLGIADLLEDGPKSSAALAEMTGVRADGLHSGAADAGQPRRVR